MGRAVDFNPQQIAAVTSLLRFSQLSQRQISIKTKISRASIYNIAKKLNANEPLSPKRKGKCGRKRKTTSRDDRQIVKIALEHRRVPLNSIKTRLLDDNIHLSKTTLRRRLKENGISTYQAVKKPKLTPKMMEKRLKWAKKYETWTEHDWAKVNIIIITFRINQNKLSYLRLSFLTKVLFK